MFLWVFLPTGSWLLSNMQGRHVTAIEKLQAIMISLITVVVSLPLDWSIDWCIDWGAGLSGKGQGLQDISGFIVGYNQLRLFNVERQDESVHVNMYQLSLTVNLFYIYINQILRTPCWKDVVILFPIFVSPPPPPILSKGIWVFHFQDTQSSIHFTFLAQVGSKKYWKSITLWINFSYFSNHATRS